MAIKKEEGNDKFFFAKDIDPYEYVKKPLVHTALRLLDGLNLYYEDGDFAWCNDDLGYACSCFFNNDSILGVKIACKLNELFSSKRGNIQVIDVVNLFKYTNVEFTSGKYVSTSANTFVLEDDTYVCVIDSVHNKVYFLKK